MDLRRFLVEAVVVGGASLGQLARSHPISRNWLFRLLARYKAGGYAALEPRSRRPKSCPTRAPPEIEQAIVDLRREGTGALCTLTVVLLVVGQPLLGDARARPGC